MTLDLNCNTTIEYTGDGVQTDFIYQFPLIEDEDIRVAFFDAETSEYDEVTTGWSLATAGSNSVVRFDVAPEAEQLFSIFRLTAIEPMKAIFQPGHPVKAGDLNDNFEQLQYAIEDTRCILESNLDGNGGTAPINPNNFISAVADDTAAGAISFDKVTTHTGGVKLPTLTDLSVIGTDAQGNIIEGTIPDYTGGVTKIVAGNNVTISPTSGVGEVTINSTGGGGGEGFSGDYNDLTNKPNFADVALSGSYNDLSNTPNFADVALSGSYNDLSNKPTIPAAQVQTNWNATSGLASILNKPDLANVATTGSYNDLDDKPTIPDTSGFVQKSGDTMSGELVWEDTGEWGPTNVNIRFREDAGIFWRGNSNQFAFARDNAILWTIGGTINCQASEGGAGDISSTNNKGFKLTGRNRAADDYSNIFTNSTDSSDVVLRCNGGGGTNNRVNMRSDGSISARNVSTRYDSTFFSTFSTPLTTARTIELTETGLLSSGLAEYSNIPDETDLLEISTGHSIAFLLKTVKAAADKINDLEARIQQLETDHNTLMNGGSNY